MDIIAELLILSVDKGNPVTLKLKGNSMFPLLRDGAPLKMRSCTDPNIGDVAAVRIKDRIIVHRIVYKKLQNRKPLYLLKGDFRRHFDGYFRGSQIIGKIYDAGGKQIDTPYRRCLHILVANFSLLCGLYFAGIRKALDWRIPIGGMHL
ncbi:MAG: S24/S26 family peptidase [archaeon]